MATALAFPLSDNGHEVRLVGTHLDRDVIDSINETGVHPGLDLQIPETSAPTSWRTPRRRSRAPRSP
jgi:hypothetical protein